MEEEKHIFQIDYHKRNIINLGDFVDCNNIDGDDTFHLDKLQQYNPLYKTLFELDESNFNNIALNHKYHIKNKNEVYEIANVNGVERFVDISRNIFIKFSPLLDSIKYMIGKYDLNDKIRNMPSILSTVEDCHEKMLCRHNTSYVDNFFYFLSSMLLNNHNFIHGIDYYGSFLGIQSNFKVNITEDLEYLTTSDFFLENIGTMFTASEILTNNSTDNYTRKHKEELLLGDEIKDIPFSDIDSSFENNTNNVVIAEMVEFPVDFKSSSIFIDDMHDNYSSSSSDNSETNYSDTNDDTSDDDSEGHDDDDDDDDDNNSKDKQDDSSDCSSFDDDELFAYIKNFPTQMICLEKCDKTFDQILVENDYNDETLGSILFQIVMILLTYQKTFNFTHNDLHTNNIMFINTEAKFIWYKYNGNIYKVPTYGRICKLIDFGRSIYKFNEDVFCSDSFSPGGDGSTQYNCEPFLDTTKTYHAPNFSFDLCRLGCCLYDFILPDDTNFSKLSPLQETVNRWVTDDNGHNVLYRKNGSIRYKGFKLYRMIARTVTQHTPYNQLNFKFFDKFKQTKNKNNTKNNIIMNIDDLPIYYK
jgi:hypothetical protein